MSPCRFMADWRPDAYRLVRLEPGAKQVRIHVEIARRAHGEIPAGHVVDHVCQRKGCINPAHLRIVTRATNNTENHGGPAEQNKSKPHCPACGGPYERRRWGGRSVRHCFACQRRRDRARVRVQRAGVRRDIGRCDAL